MPKQHLAGQSNSSIADLLQISFLILLAEVSKFDCATPLKQSITLLECLKYQYHSSYFCPRSCPLLYSKILGIPMEKPTPSIFQANLHLPHSAHQQLKPSQSCLPHFGRQLTVSQRHDSATLFKTSKSFCVGNPKYVWNHSNIKIIWDTFGFLLQDSFYITCLSYRLTKISPTASCSGICRSKQTSTWSMELVRGCSAVDASEMWHAKSYIFPLPLSPYNASQFVGLTLTWKKWCKTCGHDQIHLDLKRFKYEWSITKKWIDMNWPSPSQEATPPSQLLQLLCLHKLHIATKAAQTPCYIDNAKEADEKSIDSWPQALLVQKDWKRMSSPELSDKYLKSI